jgi:hypothetical protein
LFELAEPIGQPVRDRAKVAFDAVLRFRKTAQSTPADTVRIELQSRVRVAR